MKRRAWAALVLLVASSLLAGACGRTTEGGEGSETHWLSACSSSSDCGVGDCLCGVCTVACDSLRDCPTPLDQCLARGRDGVVCEQTVCQLPAAGVLEPRTAPDLDKVNACDAGRDVDFVRASDADLAENAGNLARVASDGSGGFLLFGPNLPGVWSVSAQGEFVRELPALPFEHSPSLERLQPLPDGSLLLVGLVGESRLEHLWLGKLDPNWKPVWEYEMELESVEQAELAVLPDGSPVVAGVRWLDRLEPGNGTDDAILARFSPDGELVWERRLSFEGMHSFSITKGFGILARTEQLLHLVVPSDSGVYLVNSDFDGNLDAASMERPLSESVRSFSETHAPEPMGVEALPDDRVVVFSAQHATLIGVDGAVELEYEVADDEYLSALRYDATRNELVALGEYIDPERFALPGPTITVFSVDGEPLWAERRSPVGIDGAGELESSPDSGPPLTDAAFDGAGNLLMTGEIGRGLEWVWVGAKACGG
jgi:hypothetical protein